jgi:hypothetical protein
LASHIKGRTNTEGVLEQGAEGNMWTERDEITGRWRKLHSEELHNLYSSPNIIRMIISRRMRWAGHVTRMGDVRNTYTSLVGVLRQETT